MAAGRYEVEEEQGGYVRNGDVLEWQWKTKQAEPESKPADEKKKPAKRPKT